MRDGLMASVGGGGGGRCFCIHNRERERERRCHILTEWGAMRTIQMRDQIIVKRECSALFNVPFNSPSGKLTNYGTASTNAFAEAYNGRHYFNSQSFLIFRETRFWLVGPPPLPPCV
jgi:hypothetical protein